VGGGIVNKIEFLSAAEMKKEAELVGLRAHGTKEEIGVKLALWQRVSQEAKSGILIFEDMTVPDLRQLKQGLGVKGTAPTKVELIKLIESSLMR